MTFTITNNTICRFYFLNNELINRVINVSLISERVSPAFSGWVNNPFNSCNFVILCNYSAHVWLTQAESTRNNRKISSNFFPVFF